MRKVKIRNYCPNKKFKIMKEFEDISLEQSRKILKKQQREPSNVNIKTGEK